MGSCLLFRSQLNHTAESLIGCEGDDTYFHQIVAGIDLAILQQRRLLSGHEIDFLHPVHLVGIQTMKLHG